MNFDDLLTQDAHEKGAEINIINPVTKEPTDFFITVMGMDSKAWRKAYKNVIRKSVENKDDDNLDAQALASITLSWRGLVDKDGKAVEFSIKKCRELYEKSPGVMDQVDRFIGERRNFTKG